MKRNEKYKGIYPLIITLEDVLDLAIYEDNKDFITMVFSGKDKKEMEETLKNMNLPRLSGSYFQNCFKIIQNRLLDVPQETKNFSIYVNGIPKNEAYIKILDDYKKAVANTNYNGTN